jgi:hypothetical protein
VSFTDAADFHQENQQLTSHNNCIGMLGLSAA